MCIVFCLQPSLEEPSPLTTPTVPVLPPVGGDGGENPDVPQGDKEVTVVGEQLLQKQEDGVVFALTGRENTAPPTESPTQQSVTLDTAVKPPADDTQTEGGKTAEPTTEKPEVQQPEVPQPVVMEPEPEVVEEERVISPVSTPMLFRPETRHELVEGEEMVSRVVSGDLTARCQPKSRVFRVFLHSAGSGKKPYNTNTGYFRFVIKLPFVFIWSRGVCIRLRGGEERPLLQGLPQTP